MATSIDKHLADLRYAIRYSNAATKITWINIIIFIVLRLIGAICVLSGYEEGIYSVLQWSVEVPSSAALLLTRPWTLITYMFAQYDVWHIIFNLLCFYWFGVILLNVTSGRRLWHLYIYGGLAGAIVYIAACNIFPGFTAASQWLIGSSASVLGVITATAILCPDLEMHLFLIGEVKLKWVAAAIIVLSFMSGFSADNLAGNFAHAGGIVTGVLYAIAYRRGFSIRRLFPRRAKVKGTTKTPRAKASETDVQQLDIILDKIKKSGYASLTSEERKRLFEVSNRIK